jgi:uncharacterized damage-inducible protein DinB
MKDRHDNTVGVLDAPARSNQLGGNSPDCRIAQSLLEEFERELGTTRKFLERVPADRLTWKPHEKSMTAGQLAMHIAQVPAGTLKFSLADEAIAPDFSAGWQQPQTLSEVLDALEGSAADVRQTLPTIDDRRMRSTFKVVQAGTSGGAGDRTLMSIPRADFLRSIMLNHWYHHRGQLGVYLRLLGAAIPPSYGPSADESPF